MMEWLDGSVAIGSWKDAGNDDILREAGIDVLVDARILFDDSDGRSHRTPRMNEIAREVKIILALKEIEAKILIRCHHGRDRAPFVAMVYLSTEKGISYQQAYKVVKEKRPRTVFHWDWVKLLESHTPGPVEDQR
jgi:hypothetical protein